jgi:hypothetical protein
LLKSNEKEPIFLKHTRIKSRYYLIVNIKTAAEYILYAEKERAPWFMLEVVAEACIKQYTDIFKSGTIPTPAGSNLTAPHTQKQVTKFVF